MSLVVLLTFGSAHRFLSSLSERSLEFLTGPLSAFFLRPTGERAPESILQSPKGLLLHCTPRETAARRLFKVDPSPLRSSSPFAEISFCHFYVFRSGGAKDSAREFLSPIGAGRSFPWVRESNSFCLPPATEREKEYKDVCTSFMDLVGLRICDAFSIFIHPEEHREGRENGSRLILDPRAGRDGCSKWRRRGRKTL